MSASDRLQVVTPTTTDWTLSSWHSCVARQQPAYPDAAILAQVQEELRHLPPLVTSWEILALQAQLAQAQEGKCFVLQGGDCAESFSDCESGLISNRLKVLLQMSLVLLHGLRLPVVRVGRFAGQYAKPRSADTETRNGVTLPSFRGDFINCPEFTTEARLADPRRMVKGHARSAMTMNFVRALIDGGFADLHHPEYWEMEWRSHSSLTEEYRLIAAAVGDAVRFVETISDDTLQRLQRTDFYTSHEALLLPYEEALTRQVPRQQGWFNLSTHFPWIGMRTADLDGAHVEYFRGLRNPLAVKIGPSVTVEHLLKLADVLNPENQPGRLTFIQRMGASKVETKLPALIEAIKREGQRILWICDPMHGNTETTSNGFKTRRFDTIRRELELSFDIHAAHGSHLGGVHLELTGENVTECLGGARELTEIDLGRAYRSTVDPRLNYEQSLEIAMLIVRKQSQLAGSVSL